MNKNEILNKLYNEKLNIDELLNLYNEMKQGTFDEFDYKVIKDYINDYIISVKSLEGLKELKRKFKKNRYNTNLVNELISRYKDINEKDLSFFESSLLSSLISKNK